MYGRYDRHNAILHTVVEVIEFMILLMESEV